MLVSVATPLAAPRAPSPSPPSGVSERDHALAYMTPQTKRLMPEQWLDAKIGRGTLAGALNDQVRFRVDRHGSHDTTAWTLVPDSPAAAAIMQSEAGERLTRQLEVGMRAAGHLGGKSELQGFILPDDDDGVVAASVLSNLDGPERKSTLLRDERRANAPAEVVGAEVRRQFRDLDQQIATAGAWNAGGWITYMPAYARNVLTAAGAYQPQDGDDGTVWNDDPTMYLARVHMHEALHSVTPVTPSARKSPATTWIEEGSVDAIANDLTVLDANQAHSGLSTPAYQLASESEPVIDLGWKPYQTPQLPERKDRASRVAQKRTYSSGTETMRGLLGLAGVPGMAAVDDRRRALDLLNAKSKRYVPGQLAKAIIDEHELDPSVYERLRSRIKVAVDLPKGWESIAEEFGLD